MKDKIVTNDGYKLSRSELPNLYKFKSAHRELLNGYVQALAAVSRLSFFVGIKEGRPVKAGLVQKILLIVFQGKFSPLRALVWRPMVKLYVEAHIYKKLKELKSIYIQEKYLDTSYNRESNGYIPWLNLAKVDCDQLIDTINPGRIVFDTIKLMLIPMINLLVAAWGASSFSDLGLRIASAEAPARGLEIVVKASNIYHIGYAGSDGIH